MGKLSPMEHRQLQRIACLFVVSLLCTTKVNSNCSALWIITNAFMYLIFPHLAPMWNENSQVYQLDFGGRVTQESAKNFQIEFRGKQVSGKFSATNDKVIWRQLIISLFLSFFPRLCNLDESMATLIHWTFSIRFQLCKPSALLWLMSHSD